jgi:hypothetical protein
MGDDRPELGDARERNTPAARVAADLLDRVPGDPMVGHGGPVSVDQEVRVDGD